jgi:hypothetical protein
VNRAEVFEAAATEARAIIGDAVAYRREHPFTFYVFHARMHDLHRSYRRGHRLRARWHRWLRDRYWAKAQATDAAARCRRVGSDDRARP